MFCVIHCFRLIRLVTLWLLICCRGGYWFSNKMFPPNKCFHYISIIDGAWVERWGIVTNETNTNSTDSFMFSLFSSLNMFVAQFHLEMLPVVRSTTVVIQRCFQFLSVSQAFPSHKANNEVWWGGGSASWAPQMLTVQTISCPPLSRARSWLLSRSWTRNTGQRSLIAPRTQ